MLLKIWSYFQGKKTYLVVLLAIVYAGSSVYFQHWTWQQSVQFILPYLGLGAFRSAVSKFGK